MYCEDVLSCKSKDTCSQWRQYMLCSLLTSVAVLAEAKVQSYPSLLQDFWCKSLVTCAEIRVVRGEVVTADGLPVLDGDSKTSHFDLVCLEATS